MPGPSASHRNAAGPVHLLDGNVLYALIDRAHGHHALARQWFKGVSGGFASFPITQGTLHLRLAMRLGGQRVEQALALLGVVTAHARHPIWPDVLPYDQVQCHGVMGPAGLASDRYLPGRARPAQLRKAGQHRHATQGPTATEGSGRTGKRRSVLECRRDEDD